MKLILATPLYPPEIGGPATYARFMETELPKQGVEVRTLPFSSVRGLPSIIRHLAYAWKLLRLARGADVIFAQDAFSVGVPALFVARLTRTPLIVRLPGEFAWEQGVARFGIRDDMETFQKRRYGRRLECIRRLQARTARGADMLIVPSEYLKRIVLAWGVLPERVRRIYNPVTSLAPEPPAEPTPKPVLLSAGRLVEGKGFSTLIGLMKDLPEWRLVIAGDGPLQDALAAHAKRLGVTSRVSLVGRISPERMRGWYDYADAFVLNTRFEAFSFQIAEALAAGIPVIATNVGGIPELVENEVTGVLVEPDDTRALRAAIESVRTDPQTWRARTSAAREASGRFAPHAIAAEVASAARQAARP